MKHERKKPKHTRLHKNTDDDPPPLPIRMQLDQSVAKLRAHSGNTSLQNSVTVAHNYVLSPRGCSI